MNNDTIFKASINVTTVIEKEITPLKIDIKLGLNFRDSNPHYQAIALERARILINVILNNSIFINRENKLCNELKKMTSTRMVECWDEPWDQFIALLIYYKLTAVMEGKVLIDYINITGDAVCSDLEYTYYGDMIDNDLDDDEDDVVWLDKNNKRHTVWYHRSDTTVNDDENEEEFTWEIYGLPWDAEKESTKKKYVNNIKPFKPKIIK